MSKLNSIAFLLGSGSLALVIYGFFYRRKEQIKNLYASNLKKRLSLIGLSLLICVLTIWAGYRFSIGTLAEVEMRPHVAVDRIVGAEGLLHDATYRIIESVHIPAPELKKGICDAIERNQDGHLVSFMGDIRKDGWWYFFPIILLLKTPPAFLLMSAIGLFFISRNTFSQHRAALLRSLLPAISAIGILMIAMLSSVNNGIRQILAIYPFLAVIAGYGAFLMMLRGGKYKTISVITIATLLSWQLASSFNAHPDYLSYFNSLAGNHPEEILPGSDLDWGQDLKRLSLRLKKRGIETFKFQYNGSWGMDLDQFNLPSRKQLEPYKREAGWIAISVYKLKLGTGEAPYDQFSWLNEYQPVEKVGKSIWLYRVPEN